MFEFYVDGGYDNIRKRNGYGSFAIFTDSKLVDIVRFELPEAKSNNEAEYLSLIKLLEWIDVNDIVNQTDMILIFSDSRLMVNQVNLEWKIKANNLRELNCKAVLPEKTWLTWTSRKNIVSVLGH